MHDDPTLLSPNDIRGHAHALRERFGPQPWLTVASGVVAEGYRLAGFSGAKFAELMRTQTAERGYLLLNLRRKPLMRLRQGFDGYDGSISDEDGVLVLHLEFDGATYEESVYVPEGGPGYVEEQRLTLPGRPRSSLLVTSGMRRSLTTAFPDLPRCLRQRSTRALGISQERSSWTVLEGTAVQVGSHWETLTLMPEEVSRELGLPRQVTLDQIPWVPVPHPGRLEPATNPCRSPARAEQERPSLSLVS